MGRVKWFQFILAAVLANGCASTERAIAPVAVSRRHSVIQHSDGVVVRDAQITPALALAPIPAEADNRPSPLEQPSAVAPPPTAPTHAMTLPDVLMLANEKNPNVILARERINEALARQAKAESLWLPSLRAGMNANHHRGAIQDVAGVVFRTTRSSMYGGVGANAVGAGSPAVPGAVMQFHVTDAYFQPRIARHQTQANAASAAAARNDLLRDVAAAYLERLRGEQALVIAEEALANTRRLTDLTGQFVKAGEGLEADHRRMEAEAALRAARVTAKREAVDVATARLAQLLHGDPSSPMRTADASIAPVSLLPDDEPLHERIAVALSRRPELGEQRALVAAAVEKLHRERSAPWLPSVLLGLSYGALGGGLGTEITNSGDRWDGDAVAYWELRQLGAGERAARDEAASTARQARLRVASVMDRIAREVAEAHARITQRRQRIELAKQGVAAALKSHELNLSRIENARGLPIEALQSVQSLAAAQEMLLDAIIDHNIAQFEMCHAMGWFVDAIHPPIIAKPNDATPKPPKPNVTSPGPAIDAPAAAS